MIKKIVTGIVCMVLIAATAWSQTEQQKKDRVQKKESENAAPSLSQEDREKPAEKEWPPPFEPSETVGADAMISFPTDI